MLNSVKIISCIFLLSFPCFLNISQHFQLVLIIIIFRSIPAPVPSHSQEWRPLIPFPEVWEWIFSFPSRSRILGMDFFHSLPVPEFWEWDFFIPFPFPKFGNGFFYSLPVPEFREWAFSIPFPFLNPQKSFPLTPALIGTIKSKYKDRNILDCVLASRSLASDHLFIRPESDHFLASVENELLLSRVSTRDLINGSILEVTNVD